MSLPLNKHVLEGAYEYLRATEPFVRWNLPEGEDVKFMVVRDRANCGKYRWFNSQHTIRVSTLHHGHTLSLIETMAHEMIHLHIEHHDIKDKSEHGPAFRRCAARVCEVHGFDPKKF